MRIWSGKRILSKSDLIHATYLWIHVFEHDSRRLSIEGTALALVRHDGLEELRAVERIPLERAAQKHLTGTDFNHKQVHYKQLVTQ